MPSNRKQLDPDPDSAFRINPEYVVATFDGQVLLYHLNRGHTISLDHTTGIVLEQMSGRCSMAEIRELLLAAYAGPPEDLERDIDRTLRYLLKHDVIDAGGCR